MCCLTRHERLRWSIRARERRKDIIRIGVRMKRVRTESGTSEDFEGGLRDTIGVAEFETSCRDEDS